MASEHPVSSARFNAPKGAVFSAAVGGYHQRSSRVEGTGWSDSCLKAIPDGRNCGVRYRQLFLVMMAELEIMSQNLRRWPSAANFITIVNKANLQEYGEVLQSWFIPDGAKGQNQLMHDGKTLRGCAIEMEDSK